MTAPGFAATYALAASASANVSVMTFATAPTPAANTPRRADTRPNTRRSSLGRRTRRTRRTCHSRFQTSSRTNHSTRLTPLGPATPSSGGFRRTPRADTETTSRTASRPAIRERAASQTMFAYVFFAISFASAESGATTSLYPLAHSTSSQLVASWYGFAKTSLLRESSTSAFGKHSSARKKHGSTISTPVQQHRMPRVLSVKFLRTSAANCERALFSSRHRVRSSNVRGRRRREGKETRSENDKTKADDRKETVASELRHRARTSRARGQRPREP